MVAIINMTVPILLREVKEPLLLPSDDSQYHTTMNEAGDKHYIDIAQNVEFNITMRSESNYMSCHGITQLVGQRTHTCSQLLYKIILQNVR